MCRYAPLVACLFVSIWLLHGALPHDGLHEGLAQAQSAVVSLLPNERRAVECQGCDVTYAPTDAGHGWLEAGVAHTPTPVPATPTPVAVAGRPCPTHLHDPSGWHPPVHASGCFYGHEHGDAPPSWAGDVGFDHDGGFHGNTSVIENIQKHPAMKGFAVSFGNGVDGYFRLHIASNPGDRASRYHSYEIFTRDAAGGISHWQGWLDSGDPMDTLHRPTKLEANQRGSRPPGVVIGVDHASWNAGLGTEQWYVRTAPGFGWDLGWGINDPTTFFTFREPLTYDVASWDINPGRPNSGPYLGVSRTLEASFYASRNPVAPRGVEFYATQFGAIVAGPTDPRCAEPTICLPHYVATTMPQIDYTVPGTNTRLNNYAAPGLTFPN